MAIKARGSGQLVKASYYTSDPGVMGLKYHASQGLVLWFVISSLFESCGDWSHDMQHCI